jgi:hypothetical protein
MPLPGEQTFAKPPTSTSGETRISFFAGRMRVRDSGFAERMAKREGLPEIRIENCADLIATNKRL